MRFTVLLSYFVRFLCVILCGFAVFVLSLRSPLKVARYSFSGPIPPKFEHKLRRHKKSFGKIATTVVLRKDENLL